MIWIVNRQFFQFEIFILLNPFLPVFPFDPPENIRKPLVFWYFQGVKRTHWEEKGWKTFPDFKWTMLSFKSTWYFFWWMFVNPQLVTSFIYLFFYFSHAILISKKIILFEKTKRWSLVLPKLVQWLNKAFEKKRKRFLLLNLLVEYPWRNLL